MGSLPEAVSGLNGQSTARNSLQWHAPDSPLRLYYFGNHGKEFLLRLNDGDTPVTPESLKRDLGLTGRESEVLLWISRGKTNRDIAQILGLSPRTIDKHLEQIYAKLGVENRTAAAAMAIQQERE